MLNKSNLWWLAVIVLANILVRGPDLYHYLRTPDDRWFTGQASWFDQIDINTFLGAIKLGQRGELLFTNFYDTLGSQKVPVYPFYVLIGYFTRSFHASNGLIFHLLGGLVSIGLILTIKWLAGLFTQKVAVSVILIVFGGGLGWMFYPKYIFPDLGMPGFTLFSPLRSPHEGVSTSLYLLTLGWMFLYFQQPKISYLIKVGISSWLLYTFHPHMAVVVGAIMIFWSVYWYFTVKMRSYKIKWRIMINLGLTLGLAFGLYLILIGFKLWRSTATSGLVNQSSISPNWIGLVMGAGLLTPFIMRGIKINQFSYLSWWFLTQMCLVVMPIPYHGMLIRALWIPAVILAVKGMGNLLSKRNKLAVASLILIIALSNLLIGYYRMTGKHVPRSIFITKEEGALIMALDKIGESGQGVLASYRIANMIPAFTNKRVWCGHNPITPDFWQRLARVKMFYEGNLSQVEAKKLLDEAKISYIFWGIEEQTLAKTGRFFYPLLVNEVVNNKNMVLYRVK